MILLDTHAWLWWEADQDRLSRPALAAIEETEDVGVLVVSCWEIAMLVNRGRLRLSTSALAWIRASLAAGKVELLPLTPEIAVRAAELDRQAPGDPMDRMISAAAVEHQATLVTRDRRLQGLPGVRTLW